MQDKYHQCVTYLFEHAAFYVMSTGMKENYFVVDVINRTVYYENKKFWLLIQVSDILNATSDSFMLTYDLIISTCNSLK